MNTYMFSYSVLPTQEGWLWLLDNMAFKLETNKQKKLP